MSTNTKILPPSPRGQAEQSHADRIAICADIGQIVPIEKQRAREHYERLAAELKLEAAARTSRAGFSIVKSNPACGK